MRFGFDRDPTNICKEYTFEVAASDGLEAVAQKAQELIDALDTARIKYDQSFVEKELVPFVAEVCDSAELEARRCPGDADIQLMLVFETDDDRYLDPRTTRRSLSLRSLIEDSISPESLIPGLRNILSYLEKKSKSAEA